MHTNFPAPSGNAKMTSRSHIVEEPGAPAVPGRDPESRGQQRRNDRETDHKRIAKPRLAQSPLLSREDERCNYLAKLFAWIELKISEGLTAKAAIRLAAGHQRTMLFKHGHLSRAHLTVLLYRYRQNRSPEIFRRHYVPGKPRIPLALVLEFLNRLATDRIVTAATVTQSLRAEWRLGRSIPGLGTWNEYLRRLHGESSSRMTPPRFPFSDKTFARCLGVGKSGAWQRRIIAARRAQRELAQFIAFIEARRNALEARRAHEQLGIPFSQQR